MTSASFAPATHTRFNVTSIQSVTEGASLPGRLVLTLDSYRDCSASNIFGHMIAVWTASKTLRTDSISTDRLTLPTAKPTFSIVSCFEAQALIGFITSSRCNNRHRE